MAVVRKSIAALTIAEKTAFVNALRQFKNTAANGRTYNWYIDQHITFFARTSDNISHAHQAPSFLPWHREYLRLLELDLQTVSGNPAVFIPYWDWTGSVGRSPTAACRAATSARRGAGRCTAAASAPASCSAGWARTGPARPRRP
jgi:tyrosinase